MTMLNLLVLAGILIMQYLLWKKLSILRNELKDEITELETTLNELNEEIEVAKGSKKIDRIKNVLEMEE